MTDEIESCPSCEALREALAALGPSGRGIGPLLDKKDAEFYAERRRADEQMLRADRAESDRIAAVKECEELKHLLHRVGAGKEPSRLLDRAEKAEARVRELLDRITHLEKQVERLATHHVPPDHDHESDTLNPDGDCWVCRIQDAAISGSPEAGKEGA